jgi:hypothetical protein
MKRTDEEHRRQVTTLRALVHEHPREVNSELYERFRNDGGSIPFDLACSVWADERRRTRIDREMHGATLVAKVGETAKAATVARLLDKVRVYLEGEAQVDAVRLRQKQLVLEEIDEWFANTDVDTEKAVAAVDQFMVEIQSGRD